MLGPASFFDDEKGKKDPFDHPKSWDLHEQKPCGLENIVERNRVTLSEKLPGSNPRIADV